MAYSQSFHYNGIEIFPIEHASFIIKTPDITIAVDPVGLSDLYSAFSPDIVLVTDIHGDHFSLSTLGAIVTLETKLLVPKEVKNKMFPPLSSRVTLLNNGDEELLEGVTIEAIPMYNLRQEALNFHTKGRGNGYVVTINKTRIYISGDTEDIPEMRALKNIDVALVCMNLPYTMTENSAASAVMEFKPKKVLPYHFRGRPKVSDIDLFESLITDSSIEVVRLDWYPKEDY
jgi:L-ascorbate metabolism protein UlaG (beta-lactamase superfamily)